MSIPKEPPRVKDISSLWEPFRQRVELLLTRMRSRGYDPVIFEAKRTRERQQWLYGFGRTHHLASRPVTWTLDSRHIPGKAVDIISKSRGWQYTAFYLALREEAERIPGLRVLWIEACHVEWTG